MACRAKVVCPKSHGHAQITLPLIRTSFATKRNPEASQSAALGGSLVCGLNLGFLTGRRCRGTGSRPVGLLYWS